MKGSSSLPFLSRNMSQAGKYQGSGLRGKTGLKKGGFSDVNPEGKTTKGKPPRKMG